MTADPRGPYGADAGRTPSPSHAPVVTGSMAASKATCPTCGVIARGSRQHCRNLAYQHPWSRS